MSALLEARGLTYAWPGGVAALDGLDLRVARGRRLAILGPNGAGKTTLLLHLNGTLRPGKGQILLDGAPVDYGRTALNDWRRRVGLVLQDADDQLFAASVAEDISFGPLNLGLSEVETRERVGQALAAMDLVNLGGRPTHMLSFGQKKRAAIAGALALQPEALLLDEPTAGLDAQGATLLIAEMEKLNAAGTTLVFTTHDANFAWGFADDVALFRDGRVIAQGAAEAILTDDNLLAQAGLAPPSLVRIAAALKARGLWPGDAPAPRGEDALLALIAGGSGRSD
jgi:cobalt/nickel transport system ATP-binding protein